MRYLAFALLISLTAAASALSAELDVRNVRLVDTGHVTSVTGTVVNITDHAVTGGAVSIAVSKGGQVVSRATVPVPPLEAGQAWRLWQPLDETASGLQARDQQTTVTAAPSSLAQADTAP